MLTMDRVTDVKTMTEQLENLPESALLYIAGFIAGFRRSEEIIPAPPKAMVERG